MNQFVDALGKACPMPVILAKKEIDAGNTSFVVAVDNEVAVQNLSLIHISAVPQIKAAIKKLCLSPLETSRGFSIKTY